MAENLEFYTREELLLAQMAGLTEASCGEPCTRKEALLMEIIENGGGSGGGAKSWNDLEDKPFGEEYVSLGDTLTWDGEATEDSSEMEGALRIQRLAADVLTAEELESGEVVYVFNGTETTMPIKGNYVTPEDGSTIIKYSSAPLFVIAPYDGFEMDGLILYKGIYAVNMIAAKLLGKSITIPNKDFQKSIVKKIDTKYIPNYKQVIEVILSYDAETDTYTTDQDFSTLADAASLGVELVVSAPAFMNVNGAQAQSQLKSNIFVAGKAVYGGSIYGYINFLVAPVVDDENVVMYVFTINADNTVKLTKAPIAIATE